jgi:hypothetical protein
VLGETCTKLLGGGRVAVDLDEAEHGRDPPQQTKACPFGFARRVGLMAKVGVLGLRGDLVVGDGEARGAEELFANLLGQLVKAVGHGLAEWHEGTT